ncbi:MAG: hypothetical protein M3N43_03160 [Actinomycetota bacterium]|nr:hypothetical protein [Actinomycetota bacterium]
MPLEKDPHPGRGDEPHAGATPTTQDRSPNEAGLGETVKAGLNRASTLGKDAADKLRETLAGSRDGEGFAQVLDGLAEFVRNQPLTALLIATGVGLCVGRLLALDRAADRG